MSWPVTVAAVTRRALIRIFLTRLNNMLIHVIAVRMMEKGIVQVVDVVAMANGRVATARIMLMVVIRVMRESASCSWYASF